MNIAIIPARGGSKRIPRKNIKPFAGKPMIAYAIEAARSSRVCDTVVVSTDDKEIARIAQEYGAEVPFTRPLELADDHTPTVPVIAHAIETLRGLGWELDKIACIYPGVPLIDAGDIAGALDVLEAGGGGGYAFPVAEFPSAIQRALRRDDTGRSAPFQPEHALTRTQDLEPAYYDAGQFYWAHADTWLAGGTIHLDAHTVVLPEWRVVDIDTPEDWDRAELAFEALRQRGADASR